MRLLIVMDAQFTAGDREGCTPLHWAAIRGNSEACTVLLQVQLLSHHLATPQRGQSFTGQQDKTPVFSLNVLQLVTKTRGKSLCSTSHGQN